MDIKIEKIVLTKEERTKLARCKDEISKKKVEKSFRGLCSRCYNLATVKVIRQIEEAQLVERYCEHHSKGLG